MSTMKRLSLGLAAVLPFLALAASSLAQSAAQGTAPAGDAARGKQIFLKDACYTCHGTTGAGGGFAGPKLAHDGLTYDEIMQQLRHPQAQMPPYTAKVLPDNEVVDIVAYIQSLSQGPAPTGKDIPLLNQ